MRFLIKLSTLTLALLLSQEFFSPYSPSGSLGSEFPAGNLSSDANLPHNVDLSQIKPILHDQRQQELTTALVHAEELIKGYYYDEALSLLGELEKNHPGEQQILPLKESCQAGLTDRQPYTGEIRHIFFHSLVVDPSKAFDGDKMSNGYNWWMTTVDEFRKMLVQMHERGYMFIDIHELWETVTDESGATVFRRKFPLLPKGKKPLVLSVDDINYYPFMEGDGFADRLMLDEHGNVAARFWIHGEPTFGEYDVVPILDNFVRTYPDFSYHGAKGILALTGYMGTLGYRTQELDAADYADRVDAAKKVIEQLKRTGWLFASHGYGHLHSARVSLERLQKDTARWKEEVGNLVGGTEIFIFPFGEEVPYQSDKLKYLQEQGFKVFCGVGCQNFLQVKKDYIRQARCDLDGYSLLKRPQRLEELFSVDEVVDHSRPPLK